MYKHLILTGAIILALGFTGAEAHGKHHSASACTSIAPVFNCPPVVRVVEPNPPIIVPVATRVVEPTGPVP